MVMLNLSNGLLVVLARMTILSNNFRENLFHKNSASELNHDYALLFFLEQRGHLIKTNLSRKN